MPWRAGHLPKANGQRLGERTELFKRWHEVLGKDERDNAFSFADGRRFAADKANDGIKPRAEPNLSSSYAEASHRLSKTNRVTTFNDSGEAVGNVEMDYGLRGCRVRITKAGNVTVRFDNLRLVKDAYYTASAVVRVKRVSGAGGRVDLDICDTAIKTYSHNTAGQEVSITGKASRYYDGQYTFTSGFVDFYFFSLAVGDVVEIEHFLMERGTEELGYVESQFDKTEWDKRLKAFDQDLSKTGGNEVDGYGTLLTGILMVKNTQQQVSAYMCGLEQSNSLGRAALALGVSDFNTAAERSMVRFNHDGSGHIGAIEFDNAGGTGSVYMMHQSGENAGKKSVEFTNRPLPTRDELAAMSNATFAFAGGTAAVIVTGNTAGAPTKMAEGETARWQWNGYRLNSPEVKKIATQFSLMLTRTMLGEGSGSFLIELIPDATERAKYPVELPTDEVSASVGRAWAGMTFFSENKTSMVLDLSNLRNLAADTYTLNIEIRSLVGTPRVRITPRQPAYKAQADVPYNAVAVDGVMSYLNSGQYAFIKEGVLNVKGQMQAQVVQA
ncbi:MAG: hypothetical protein HUK09_02700, partial [Bacteroidaceae bacterium]|nr:hypothetical protein [Bacteroidaceae bacterium]